MRSTKRSRTDLLDRIPKQELQGFVNSCKQANLEFSNQDEWLQQIGSDYLTVYGSPECFCASQARRTTYQIGVSLAYQFSLTQISEHIAGRSHEQNAVKLLLRYRNDLYR